MESGCLRYSEIPHTSKLFLDFQYHFERVARFYGHCPLDARCYASAAREMDYPAERRAALVDALRASNGESEALDRLGRQGTLAVVTGQQVGLFSGPAYTVYKALTAVKLAETLSARGIEAVPVFWLATEDHDFAEVNHTWVFDRAQRPVRLEVNGSAGVGQPVGTIGLEDPPIEELRRALAGFPFAEETMDAVAEAYRPGASMGAAFQALLRRLLGNRGLLFIDPLDERVRQIAAPLMARAVRQAPELKTVLLERNRELEAAGYHAQVHVEPQTSLFFVLEGGRRITLRRQETDYTAKDGRYGPEELAGMAERLSPNALLRPVMQDYILPTVAYVGGPAELAYLAQSEVLYRALLGRMPVALSRSSFTLVDERAAKAMDRCGVGLPDVLKSPDEVAGAIARKLVPQALHERIDQTRTTIERAMGELRRDLTGFDPTLAAALDKSGAKIAYQISKIAGKTARETLRRDERAREDAASLSGLLYPEKHLQERLYSIIPFMAQHGDGLLDTLYSNIHLECPDHTILAV